MSSFPWTTQCQNAKSELEALQRDIYVQLAIPEPEDRFAITVEEFERYARSNPDVSENERARIASELALRYGFATRPDIAHRGGSASAILADRVDALKAACESLGYDPLPNVCFGTVPGGGLDSYTFQASAPGEYAVVIPDGLFYWCNLACKIVILLQPFHPTPEGLAYLPTASFAQFALAKHPYIAFRHRDLMRALYLWGEPRAALPYRQAVPYQDRFAYLLAGTELFVLAHEAAHVLLRHFGVAAGVADQAELDADAFALQIVTQHFRLHGMNVPAARASLCGALFLSLVKNWEQTVSRLLAVDVSSCTAHHASFASRLNRFISELDQRDGAEKTPSWYIFVHNAIRIATDMMDAVSDLDEAPHKDPHDLVSARALPLGLVDRGHNRRVPDDHWWKTIASLLTSVAEGERAIGLWLFLQNCPAAGVGLYDGAAQEDSADRELFRNALISIEPMYRAYLPRLVERFREAAEQDELLDYKLNITSFLEVKAAIELGEDKISGDPVRDWRS